MMFPEVETISDHYRRQASPEVWAEVDALRGRVAKLEAALAALQELAQPASGIETEGQDRETGLGAEHESPAPKGGRP